LSDDLPQGHPVQRQPRVAPPCHLSSPTHVTLSHANTPCAAPCVDDDDDGDDDGDDDDDDDDDGSDDEEEDDDAPIAEAHRGRFWADEAARIE
jgi:hypothetical protein